MYMESVYDLIQHQKLVNLLRRDVAWGSPWRQKCSNNTVKTYLKKFTNLSSITRITCFWKQRSGLAWEPLLHRNHNSTRRSNAHRIHIFEGLGEWYKNAFMADRGEIASISAGSHHFRAKIALQHMGIHACEKLFGNCFQRVRNRLRLRCLCNANDLSFAWGPPSHETYHNRNLKKFTPLRGLGKMQLKPKEATCLSLFPFSLSRLAVLHFVTCCPSFCHPDPSLSRITYYTQKTSPRF